MTIQAFSAKVPNEFGIRCVRYYFVILIEGESRSNFSRLWFSSAGMMCPTRRIPATEIEFDGQSRARYGWDRLCGEADFVMLAGNCSPVDVIGETCPGQGTIPAASKGICVAQNAPSSFNLNRAEAFFSNLAFVGAVLAAMVTAWLNQDQPLGLLAATGFWIGGVLYAVLGEIGFNWTHKQAHRGWLYVYFGVQAALGLGLIWLGRGEPLIGLILIPLSSQFVLTLPSPTAFAATGLLLLAGSVAHYVGGLSLAAVFSLMVSYAAATIAIDFFTLSAARERSLRTRVEQLNQELAEANDKLRDHARQSAALATAEERNRLAREIHDSLGHTLTTVSIQLDAARQLIVTNPAKAEEVVQKAHALTRQGLQDVREAVAAWRSSPLTGQSLSHALDNLVKTARQTGLPIDYRLEARLDDLPPSSALTLYRAAQEALTNIHKHSQATSVEMVLTGGSVITLCVRNDGLLPYQSDSTGYGLQGLRERILLQGGTLQAGQRADTEFLFEVQLPWPNQP